MLSKWFINFELPIAMGLISVVPIAGSVVSGIAVPELYTYYDQSFEKVFSYGVVICLICFLLVLVMVMVDKSAEKHDDIVLLNYITEQKIALGIPVNPSAMTSDNGPSSGQRYTTFNQTVDSENNISMKDIYNLSSTYWFSCLACCFTYISVVNYVMIFSAIL